MSPRTTNATFQIEFWTFLNRVGAGGIPQSIPRAPPPPPRFPATLPGSRGSKTPIGCPLLWACPPAAFLCAARDAFALVSRKLESGVSALGGFSTFPLFHVNMKLLILACLVLVCYSENTKHSKLLFYLYIYMYIYQTGGRSCFLVPDLCKRQCLDSCHV